MFPKYTLSELRKNLRYVFFDPPSWFQFLALLLNMRNWVDIESSVKDGHSILKHKSLGIIYHSPINYGRLIIAEWDIWRRFYSFPFSLKDKTVLDIGAGAGETALFYFICGAEKVICIENNKQLVPFLEKNRDVNQVNMQIINEPFNLKHLYLGFDAAKMDIEEGEKELLKIENIAFPLVAEIHSEEMERAFMRRGLKIRCKPRETRSAIMDNFGE